MWSLHAMFAAARSPVGTSVWRIFRATFMTFAITVSAHASPNNNLVISKVVNGATAWVMASSNYGGAITSLNYRDFEYVNTFDKGREIQSAMFFDTNGYNECWAPTQAGNRIGHASYLPYSIVDSDNGVLYTETLMKYWQPYSQDDRSNVGCGTHPQYAPLPYYSDDSDVLLKKTVTFDTTTAAAPNVLNFFVDYDFSGDDSHARFEINSAYLNPTLNNYYIFHPESSSIATLSLQACGEKSCIGAPTAPILVATSNGQHAVGVYAESPTFFAGYHVGGVGATSSVTCLSDTVVSGYTYGCKLVFGTVEEVTHALRDISTSSSIKITPVFRFYKSTSGDHFPTVNFSEGASNGYAFEATAFRIFEDMPDAESMIPLYRCSTQNGTYHYVSNDYYCEWQTHEGTYGYVSSCERSGYEALYRFYNSANTDHLITTNAGEGYGAGYSYDGILGYAPTANGSIPACSN